MEVSSPYLLRSGTSGRTIVLTLDLGLFRPFPELVRWKKVELYKKDEFHITLLHIKNASELAQLPPVDFENEVARNFETFTRLKPIQLLSLRNDFRFAEEGERKAIVLRCELKNLSDFFKEFNRQFRISLPTQPAHVTLYTLQRNVGIHIPSEEVMEDLPKVSLPILDEALRGVHI